MLAQALEYSLEAVYALKWNQKMDEMNMMKKMYPDSDDNDNNDKELYTCFMFNVTFIAFNRCPVKMK